MFLDFGNEMNAEWSIHSGSNNGGGETTGYGDPLVPDGPERFIDAWRHVHHIFSAVGAGNISWVFAPNAANVPWYEWNHMENYYPGDEYVDWLGLDGYNFGTAGSSWGSRWITFEEIFNPPSYRQLEMLMESYPGKPFVIAEMASTEEGGNKATWILDAYNVIKEQFPRIHAVNWFNINKETDWRFDSSPESLAAFQQALLDEYYLNTIPEQ